MRPITIRRPGAAAAAIAAGLLVAALAGCASSPGGPRLGSPVPNPAPVNFRIYPNLDAARQQAATALAVKILSHL